MKTLKKTLCLVLAVVMAVGVLILPANADKATYEDFDDLDKINPDYEIAVATLTGMGIIAGKDNGFDPQGTLLRQEAATLVVNTMLTKTQQTTALLGYESKFVDIDASYAKNAINYLVNKGVVSGKDETHFAPYATLTTYELLTMLRRVAEIKNGYVPGNGDYTTEALAFANAYGLVKTSLTRVFSNPNLTPTREEAAQIIWDTVTYDPVTGGKGYDVYELETGNREPTQNQTPVATNVETAELAYWKAILGDDFYFETAGSVANSIAGTVYGLDDGTDTDIYGHVTDTYTNGGNTVYSAFPRTAVLTYEDQFTTKQLLNALGVATNKTITVSKCVVDGEVQTNEDDEVQTYTVNANNTKVGGKGMVVEIFKNDNNTYDVIVRNVYAHVLASTEVHAATTTTPAYIDLPGNIEVETDAYKGGNVVLYTKGVDNSGDTPAAAAEVFTPEVLVGYVTAVNDNEHYARINGESTKYYASATFNDSGNVLSTLDPAKSLKEFYFDFSGNVIFVRAYTGTTVAPVYDGYVYVVKYASQDEDSGEGDALLGTAGTGAKNAVARAEIIDFATGEHKSVDLAIIKDGSEWYFKNTSGTKDATKLVGDVSSDDCDDYIGIYQYKKFEDGTYCLSNKLASVSGFALTKSKANVTGVAGAFANNSTVLHVLTVTKTSAGKVDTSKTVSHSVTSGYTSFPAIAADTVLGAYVVTGTPGTATESIIREIYVIKTPDTVYTPVNFAVYIGEGETTEDGTMYTFAVGGNEVMYYGEETAEYIEGTVYNLNVVNNEISECNPVADAANKVDVESLIVLDTNLVAAGNDVYELADGVLVYAVSGTTVAKASVSDLEDEMVVTLYRQSATAKVELIVITVTD